MTLETANKIQALAEAYITEFDETTLCPEWSQTAYEDFKTELVYADFHADLENEIEYIAGNRRF